MMKWNHWISFGFCVFFILTQEVSAQTYYVSEKGDDTLSGQSKNQAWQSIRRANKVSKRLKPGDQLLFKRGDRFGDKILKLKASGSAEKPIVIGAYGEGPPPIFDGGGINKVGIQMYQPNTSHILIENLHIANSKGRNGITADAEGMADITIQNVTIENLKGNGIALTGVRGFRVENTCIRGTSTNGIYISSGKKSVAQNGVIRHNVVNCQGASNDGITFHQASKRKGGTHNGGNHLIEGNVAHHCGEQGFDLTSGFDIILRDNLSYENRDGAILTSDKAKNILIERHTSIRDAEKKGAVIIKHDGVKLVDSLILAPRYHALVIHRGKGFEASGNLFMFDKYSRGSMVDVVENSRNAHIHNNRFISLNRDTKRFIRFLDGSTAKSTKSRFDNNIWWRPGDTGRLFQDALSGKYGLNKWRSYYGQGKGSKIKRVDLEKYRNLLKIPRKPTPLEQQCWGKKG